MRKVFVSYARVNRVQVDKIVEHLGFLDCQPWIDSSLRGGQAWWDEILRNIADCDVFMPIISRDSLNSTACQREFDWAEALHKPVLPVAVETPSKALPPRLSMLQIVDYSDGAQSERSALALAGALATVPAAPPLPESMPEPPAVPLSYLNDLAEVVSGNTPLDHEQQRELLVHVEHALRSVDPQERLGGLDILERFSSRDNLYADVDRRLAWLKANTPGVSQPAGHAAAAVAASPAPPASKSAAAPAKPKRGKGKFVLVAAVVVVAAACLVGFLLWPRGGSSPTQSAQSTKLSGQGAQSASAPAPVGQQPGPAGGQSTQPASSGGQTDLPFADLTTPRAVAVDKAGNVYVADRFKGVFELTTGATSSVQLPFTGIGQTEGVAVDTAGAIYATDNSKNTLWKLTPNATAPAAVPVGGLKCGEFENPISLSNPTGVTVDSAGTIYLTDGACGGRVLALPGGSGTPNLLPFTGLQNPGGVALDSSGNLYVVDGTMSTNGRVLKLAPGSTRPEPLPFTGLSAPQSVAVDSAGDVYVTDTGNKRLLKLAAGSSAPSTVPYTFKDSAAAVAVDSAGNVYVTDGNRVVKLGAS